MTTQLGRMIRIVASILDQLPTGTKLKVGKLTFSIVLSRVKFHNIQLADKQYYDTLEAAKIIFNEFE